MESGQGVASAGKRGLIPDRGTHWCSISYSTLYMAGLLHGRVTVRHGACSYVNTDIICKCLGKLLLLLRPIYGSQDGLLEKRPVVEGRGSVVGELAHHVHSELLDGKIAHAFDVRAWRLRLQHDVVGFKPLIFPSLKKLGVLE